MTIFPHSAHENALRTLFASLFEQILVHDSKNDYTWERRTRSFRVNGLLSFRMPSPFAKHDDFVVDNSRLGESRYRRYVSRELTKPRPRQFTYVHLPIDRSRLDDDRYVSDIATLLAWNWVRKLMPVSGRDMVLLTQYDLPTLTRALDTMAMHQSSGENVARLRLRRHVQDVIDNHAGIQRVFADFEARMAGILADAERKLQEWKAEQDAKDIIRFEEMRRDTDARFAEAHARIHGA